MPNNSLLLRCKSCNTLNRVPADKLGDHPICGKCKTPLEFPMAPVHWRAANFKQEVLDWPGTVLIEFWAKWCGACRMIAPVLDELALQKAGFMKVIKIDVDEEQQLAGSFHVKATPTLVLYQNGRKVNEIAGALNKEQMESWIEGSLKG